MPQALDRGEGVTGAVGRPWAAAVLFGVAAVSAAGLAFEIALTRVFAVAQFYHFAFLAVSLALLGFGASGSALTVFPRLGRGGPRRWAVLAGAQSLTIVGAYGLANALPFDSFAIAWDRRQVVYLIAYYLALAAPFFFGGLIIAILLAGGSRPEEAVPSHRVYAASLVGSGLGAVIALLALDRIGGEASIMLAAATAMAGAATFASAAPRARWTVGVALVALAGLIGLTASVPAWLEMRLSPYKDLSAALRYPDAELVAVDWDHGTRVDLIVSDGIRSSPGLSLTYSGALPPQDGVTFDADDLSPVLRGDAAGGAFASHMLTALPFQLRPGGEALILGSRGGLDVAIAVANGAGSVDAVEPLRGAVEAIRATGTGPYDDPKVTVITAEPRTFIERTSERFDVIDLALSAPYRPVASGAYSLAEDYRITVEAFERYLDRLSRGGVFAAARWVQVPPSEEIRLLATAAAALRRAGRDPAAAVVMLRGYATALLLVQPEGFSANDLVAIRDFAETRRFDVVAAPGLDVATSNRYNVVPDEQYSALAASLLTAADPEPVYRAHEFEIAPPTDDHPFFGHYFKWTQATTVFDTLGRTWQPFGGAGYFVLIALLVISTAAAVLLIVLPLAARRSRARSAPVSLRWWTFGYFGLLGIAFLFVEIPLIQQFILLIGQPAAAFAVVLFAILVASGIGSAWSRRIRWRPGAVTLAALAALYPFVVAWVTPVVLAAPYVARLAAATLLIAPLGFLMGIMFPRGLAHLEGTAPQLVPWAWAVNGTVSVTSAAAAAILVLGFGFSFVVRLGAVAYAAAAIMARPAAALPTRRG